MRNNEPGEGCGAVAAFALPHAETHSCGILALAQGK